MVVDGRGRAYVGNFGFDMYAGAKAETTCVIAVEPDGDARVAADGLAFPNGSVVTPDGSTLLVGESMAARIRAFDIASDGSLVEPARLGPTRRCDRRRNVPRCRGRDLGRVPVQRTRAAGP